MGAGTHAQGVPSAASRSPALLPFSPQYGPQLSPLKSCSFRSQGALLKINAGPDFPLQTRKWIGLGLCINPIRFSRMDYWSLGGKLGSPSWVWFYSEAERRKEECIYKFHLTVTIWGSLPSCCSNFSCECFLLFYPLPPLTLVSLCISIFVLFFFLRDRVGVALELPKINILPLLCYSEFSCLPEIPLASTSKLFHEQAPGLLKFSEQSHWGHCVVL